MVASYTQLLSRRYSGKLDQDGLEFMRYIIDGVQTIQRLVEDLLAYSLQLRPLDKSPSTVDSDAVARGVLLILEKQIRESGAEVTHQALPPRASPLAVRPHSSEPGLPSTDIEFHQVSWTPAASHSDIGVGN